MSHQLYQQLEQQLAELDKLGLYKRERVICSPQSSLIKTQDGREVINLCANNYLGLADHPELIAAAKQSLDRYGYGMASVRFICGTQDIHKQLEATISQFLKQEDTILFSSCFDANGGIFEALLGEEDAVISDALNHASIIDGIRLCKAKRFRYANNDMNDLEAKLQEAKSARHRLIVTDGVFSMDGIIADLPAICALAKRYDALVMVDDSHAVGFMGAEGRGTPELCNVMDQVDIISGTLGKALGGGSGGYISAKKPVIDWLRNRARPYLFSNTLAPVITATSLQVFAMLAQGKDLRARLHQNSAYFRKGLSELGFNLIPGEHPIIPVMLGDAQLSARFADTLLKEGIYVISFSYPVVPQGKARIRTQMSAALTREQLDRAIAAFGKVGRELGIIIAP
jgi:glycine C-acetyltransferase